MRSMWSRVIVVCGAMSVAFVEPSPSRAQDIPVSLTPKLAREILLMRNPDILRVRENVAIARAGVIEARLRRNPHLDIFAERYPQFESNRGPVFQNSELTVRVGQPIEMGGKRAERRRVAEQDVEVARWLLQDTIRRAELELNIRYYRVVHTKAMFEITQEALRRFDEIARLTQLRHRQGEASGLDAMRVETAHPQYFDDLVEAEVALPSAKFALLELLGATDLRAHFDVTESLEFQSLAEDLDPEELVAAALEQRPDLRAVRAQLEREQHQVVLERALRVPDVTPFFGYQRLSGEHAVTFGVRTELPLFNRNQGGVARAAARTRQAQHDEERNALIVRREVQDAYELLRGQKRRVGAFAATSVPNVNRSRELAHLAYRMGALEVAALLDIENAYHRTHRTYNQVLLDWRIARFRLEAAVGRDLP